MTTTNWAQAPPEVCHMYLAAPPKTPANRREQLLLLARPWRRRSAAASDARGSISHFLSKVKRKEETAC